MGSDVSSAADTGADTTAPISVRFTEVPEIRRLNDVVWEIPDMVGCGSRGGSSPRRSCW
jgi:hypothetical protein